MTTPRILPLLLALAGCATTSAVIAPAPVAQAAVSPVSPSPPLPRGVFRFHIESPPGIPLTEHLGIVDTHYGVASVNVIESTRLACVSPCDAVLDARTGHEFTLDATAFPAPRAFRLPGEGGDLTLFVTPGNERGLTAGRWVTALGSLALGYGVIAVAFDYKDGPAPLTVANGEALGLLATGAVAVTGGILLLITQHTKIRFATGTPSRLTTGAVSF